MSQQQPQQQQPQQEGSRRVVTGGGVCVWDAFGAFWCEAGSPTATYVQRTTQRQDSRPIVYEGFCGCGADSPSSF